MICEIRREIFTLIKKKQIADTKNDREIEMSQSCRTKNISDGH